MNSPEIVIYATRTSWFFFPSPRSHPPPSEHHSSYNLTAISRASPSSPSRGQPYRGRFDRFSSPVFKLTFFISFNFNKLVLVARRRASNSYKKKKKTLRVSFVELNFGEGRLRVSTSKRKRERRVRLGCCGARVLYKRFYS